MHQNSKYGEIPQALLVQKNFHDTCIDGHTHTDGPPENITSRATNTGTGIKIKVKLIYNCTMHTRLNENEE